MRCTIGIDITGAETDPKIIIQAVLSAAKDVDARFLLFSTPFLEKEMKKLITSSPFRDRVSFHVTPEIITMHDTIRALFQKKKTVLVEAILSLRDRNIDALVTCGNTAVLVAACHRYLATVPYIHRTALMAHIPTGSKGMFVLDVGATLTTNASQLIEHAFLGAAYARTFRQEAIKVALLNIGVESVKGTRELQNAWKMLSRYKEKLPFIFQGNIEPKELFFSDLDVVVTSGFIGNVFIKTIEGVANYFLNIAQPEKHIEEQLHEKKAQGAPLLGVDRNVFKCHGASSKEAIEQAIRSAYEAVVVRRIDHMKEFMQENQLVLESLKKE